MKKHPAPQVTRDFQLQADRFYLEKASFSAPDGRSVVRDIIQHPGAVVIVPVLPDKRICLIQNFRVAIGQWMLELPAGTREPNEPPIETAARELIEETGFTAGNVTTLCDFFMSPGILNEHMFAFLAEDLTAGDAKREAGELIDNVLVTVDEALELIRTGAIQDAKTIAALLFYQRFYGD